MDLLTLGLLLAGLVLLSVGGELLVRGASGLAGALGVPPLLIGLTVVAFGTSAPEAAVSVLSALAGQSDLAVGNVVGSNVFNVLFILGLSAVITPLAVAHRLVRLDVPLMLGTGVLVLVLALDLTISRLEALLLLAGIVAYTGFLLQQTRGERPPDATADAMPQPERSLWLANGLRVVLGLAALVLGSRWLIDGAITIARAVGVSELVIGLTIVAAGTSLPEVAASVIASLRGERDIAVGNVVGSNLFNLLFVLGAAGLVGPGGLTVAPAVLAFDLPVMLAAMVACLPIFFTGGRIDRWEGLLFFAYYVAYTLFLMLQATQHDALPAFSGAMLGFVLPLTIVTLIVLFAWTARRSTPPPG